MSEKPPCTRLFIAALLLLHSSCSYSTAWAQANYDKATGTAFRVDNFYRHRQDGQPGRPLRIRLQDSAYHGPVALTVTGNGKTAKGLCNSDSLYQTGFLLPAGMGVDSACTAQVSLSYAGKEIHLSVPVRKTKQWTVYIYPHSHLDIGYTGLPSAVQQLQCRNIDVGIELAEKTQHYPEGARFVWNPESSWVVKHYLQQASDEKKARFVQAVKKGWLQLDAGHSNINTSTCSDEELLHFFTNTTAIEKVTGMPITSMVQMDVPGAAWGLVPAAAQFGVKGMISFPNNYDTRRDAAHKPFYWLAPDGKTKMLFLQGYPYGIGYTIKGRHYGLSVLQQYSSSYDRVQTADPTKNFLDPFILQETSTVEMQNSPYDLFAMTWSMADNCVIDADLPEAVKAWNEKYAYPHLVISGSATILNAFEKKYSAVIPTYSGDFTEFWTNGLGADAASVGAGRIAKEKLVQAATLLSMLPMGQWPGKSLDSAWENCLLSAEHTWGAQDSKSLLAQQVEKIKAGYFTNSSIQAEALLEKALAPYRDSSAARFAVINTLSWPRTGIVTIPAAAAAGSTTVLNEKNAPVPAQRLTNGDLIFLATAVPAFGASYYFLGTGLTATGNNTITATAMENDSLAVRLDASTGFIKSIRRKADGYEYVNALKGVNSYHYVGGVYNGQDYPKEDLSLPTASCSVKENGPLLQSLRVRSQAPGVQALTTEVKLYSHQAVVEIENVFEKQPTRNKESIHTGFSFTMAGAQSRMEMPWSIVRPNVDQLSYANKNWFAIQRWADISNNEHGVTWCPTECPLVEWGVISGNILDGARQYGLWKKELAPSASLYSFVLNNHWDTNFPLQQGGTIKERYAMQFHIGYNAVAASRFGMEPLQPLLLVQTNKKLLQQPMMQINNPSLLISSCERTSKNVLMLRVKSVSENHEPLQLQWPGGKPKQLVLCNAAEEPIEKVDSNYQLAPYAMATLQAIF